MPAPGYHINRVLKDFKYISGATHFLCIPLATKISRPQLASSLRTLANDPCAANVPKEAFRWLESIHISLGAMSLHTPAAVEAAVNIVREALLRHLTFPLGNQSKQIARDPLKVSMTGLGLLELPGLSVKNAGSLLASVAEPTGQLLRLCHDIYHCLAKHCLWRQTEQNVGLVEGFPLATIVSTRQCPSNEPMGNSALAHLGRQVFRSKTFNATEIHRQYDNYTFATWFPLERFSIREMGLKHMIKHDGLLVNQAHREIASIPLPGFLETRDSNQQAVHMLPIGINEKRPPPHIVDDLPGQPSEPHSHLFSTVGSERRKHGRNIRFGGETL